MGPYCTRRDNVVKLTSPDVTNTYDEVLLSRALAVGDDIGYLAARTSDRS
jgi:hypothetical protein